MKSHRLFLCFSLSKLKIKLLFSRCVCVCTHDYRPQPFRQYAFFSFYLFFSFCFVRFQPSKKQKKNSKKLKNNNKKKLNYRLIELNQKETLFHFMKTKNLTIELKQNGKENQKKSSFCTIRSSIIQCEQQNTNHQRTPIDK